MPIPQQQTAGKPPVNMIGKAIEVLLHRLGKAGDKRHQYRLQAVENGCNDLFQIAEKAEAGRVWEDGQKWKTWRGPTAVQMRIMEQTSQSLDEFVGRIYRFIFEGEDTTRPVVQQGQVSPYDTEAINKLVEAKVAAILSDPTLARQLKTGTMAPNEVVHAANKRDLTEPTTQGLQQRRKRNSLASKKAHEFRVVKERCTLLGIPHEQIQRNGEGWVSKIWLRRLDVRWAEYCAKHGKGGQAVEIARQAIQSAPVLPEQEPPPPSP